MKCSGRWSGVDPHCHKLFEFFLGMHWTDTSESKPYDVQVFSGYALQWAQVTSAVACLTIENVALVDTCAGGTQATANAWLFTSTRRESEFALLLVVTCTCRMDNVMGTSH